MWRKPLSWYLATLARYTVRTGRTGWLSGPAMAEKGLSGFSLSSPAAVVLFRPCPCSHDTHPSQDCSSIGLLSMTPRTHKAWPKVRDATPTIEEQKHCPGSSPLSPRVDEAMPSIGLPVEFLQRKEMSHASRFSHFLVIRPSVSPLMSRPLNL